MNDPEKELKYDMIIPNNDTLDEIEDVGSYGAPKNSQVAEILEVLENHSVKTHCRHYIISYDGIIVIPRYKYNDGLDLVLSGSIPLSIEEYNQRDREVLDDDLGNEILQFMFLSLEVGFGVYEEEPRPNPPFTIV